MVISVEFTGGMLWDSKTVLRYIRAPEKFSVKKNLVWLKYDYFGGGR